MKKILTYLCALAMLAAMALPVAASSADFVNSIDLKLAPELVDQTDSNGNTVAGIIYDRSGKEIIGVPGDAIIITPLSGKDAADEDTAAALQAAYEQILNADSLSDLTSGLSDWLKTNASGVTAADLVVTQLFDVRVSDAYEQYLQDGATLSVVLRLTDDLLTLLARTGDEWGLGDYVINGDGTVTLKLAKASTQVVFLKNALNVNVDPDNPAESSPQTGSELPIVWIALGTAFALGAAVCFAAAKKQSAR